jgi:DoxX-like family
MYWAGWVVSMLPVLMLLYSASGKFLQPKGMEEGLEHLGWKMDVMLALGVVEVACTALYLIPKTSVLGAILLTGYLGGATATHVRVGDPVYVFLSPVVFGVLVWLGIYLRCGRLRALIPLRT